ncbi:MAG: glycosyltransferase family 39 protein [Anaerolineales bacterium]|nr:glycosyltransferase family 39 protein [Anaerolineales bacterium]
MIEEPSVLDYIKSRLAFWRKEKIVLTDESRPKSTEASLAQTGLDASEMSGGGGMAEAQLLGLSASNEAQPATAEPAHATIATHFPWVGLTALLLGLIAQLALEPVERDPKLPLFFYGMAALGVILAARKGNWLIPNLPEARDQGTPFKARTGPFIIGCVTALVAFFLFGKISFFSTADEQFTSVNITLWLISLLSFVWAFWTWNIPWRETATRWITYLRASRWQVSFNRQTLLAVMAIAVILFFRFYRLNDVPPEMVSDQAEKLLDVYDVLNGQYNVFFPRNTGREAFQFYLTAAISLIFGTGVSFLSLKLGTVLAGLVTLPYIYLLGKEMGGRQVGFYAALFAGIAYWPNVISRIGLRFALYPLFTAPVLFYLVRGLRRSSRNDFILAGIFLGLGLHGYSPFRIVPFVVVAAVGLYLIHRQPPGARRQAIFGLFIIAFFSLIIFLPLLRYALENPEMFSYRAMTRLGTLEKPLDAPAWQIFLKNLWNALVMFAWDNGEVWVVSIPHRPALSMVSAAMFHLGLVLAGYRYWKQRSWQDIFLALSIPLLLMPSILSLAFPAENPILNRTAGAYVPAFVFVGIAMQGCLSGIRRAWDARRGLFLAWIVGLFLFTAAARQDYKLVFEQYAEDYLLSAWNTSEMGKVLGDFSRTIGSPETIWVVAYPYWVDTRLVGMQAGYPALDTAINPDQISETVADPRPKLFLVSPDDVTGLETLRDLYPDGSLKKYQSRVETKDFWMFFAPPLNSQP